MVHRWVRDNPPGALVVIGLFQGWKLRKRRRCRGCSAPSRPPDLPDTAAECPPPRWSLGRHSSGDPPRGRCGARAGTHPGYVRRCKSSPAPEECVDLASRMVACCHDAVSYAETTTIMRDIAVVIRAGGLSKERVGVERANMQLWALVVGNGVVGGKSPDGGSTGW